MTWTALALVLTLGAVAWIVASVVLALGLGALVARNRSTVPAVAPTRVAAVSRISAHAA